MWVEKPINEATAPLRRREVIIKYRCGNHWITLMCWILAFFVTSVAVRLTRGKKMRSPNHNRLSARPEYVATFSGGTLTESRTFIRLIKELTYKQR